jgi:signal transduction histidine kinase/CheY-like chemotaxis protein/HPt (histidine-containing phosphotransfer) domain-containing protein
MRSVGGQTTPVTELDNEMAGIGKLNKDLPWYGPGAFAVATCIVVFALILLIRSRTLEERSEKISSDLDSVVSMVEGQVSGIRDFLLLISEEYSDGRLDEETFHRRSERFLSENEELSNLRFIDATIARRWVSPQRSLSIHGTEISKSELLKAYRQASTDLKPSFSKPYTSYSGHNVVSIFVPLGHESPVPGAFAAEINLATLLSISVSDKLATRYAVELLGDSDQLVASHRTKDFARSSLVVSRKIKYFDEQMAIRITHYREPIDLQFFGMASLCIGLALGLAWAMWILGKDNYHRRRIQIELEKTKNAAEAANNAKSELIANISHEIRTPLGAIQGFADLLGATKNLPTELQKNVQAIRRNSRNLLELLNDLLDLSKIEAGLLEIENIDFFIGDKISEVFDLFSTEARQKGISLKAVYEGPIPETISSDPKRIGQILINLLGNAVKFTDSGEIVITTALRDGVNGKKFLTFEISDTGIGMSQEQVTKLFKPFTQADSSINRKYGGTGLGLSLSKKICEKLGGTIVLKKTQEGVGSVFTASMDIGDLSGINLLVGVRQVVDPILSEDLSQSAYRLDQLKVLVVEDCRDNQIIYTQFIESVGGIVETADDGIEGLEKAKSEKFDAILLDIQMPRLNGYSTARRLREEGVDTPIIALTAHAMKGERERCIQAGANEYLTKPVRPEVLTMAIGVCTGTIRKDSKVLGSSQVNKLQGEAEGAEGPLYSKFFNDPRVMPVLRNFVEGMQGRVDNLREAIEASNWEEVRRIAHSFKGTAGNYGFPDIALCASEIELEMTGEQNKKNVLAQLEGLEKLSARARQAVVIS